MKKQIEAMNQAKEKLEVRISDLNTGIKKKANEKATAEALYREMLLEDSSGEKTHSTTELNKVKQRAEALELEIQVDSDRLQVLEAGKEGAVKKFLPDIQAARIRALEGIKVELDKIEEEARELRAKLTLKVMEANVPLKKAQELLQDLKGAEYMAGVPWDRQTTDVGVPTKPKLYTMMPIGMGQGTKTYDESCIMPAEEELIKAYARGEVPAWIKHYANTGKLVTDEEAREHAAKRSNSSEGKGFVDRLLNR
ncbi:hypothetical protein FHS16_001748 [Paenibacillus endophyticus]|uniref:Uncharacterized protein n=1 Tax=Paenibacillus endophyticus TaxID=1294268 RepID=A0A7W5C686_9BACL|nr:hypothetical protein [Paenibacillus endophyticus]MBB3151702.1 hypothetical protein [Paenibacillus endophyticus]